MLASSLQSKKDFEGQLEGTQSSLKTLVEDKLDSMQKTIDTSLQKIAKLHGKLPKTTSREEHEKFQRELVERQQQLQEHLDTGMRDMQTRIDASIQAASQKQYEQSKGATQNAAALLESKFAHTKEALSGHIEEKLKAINQRLNRSITSSFQDQGAKTSSSAEAKSGEVIDAHTREYIAEQVRKKIKKHMVMAAQPQDADDDELYGGLRRRGKRQLVRRLIREIDDEY